MDLRCIYPFYLSIFPGAVAVRVNAYTNEVIQLQRLGIRDLVIEARHRSLNMEHCLGALHHVLGLLARVEPATYILKLCPSEGVAELIQQDSSGTNLRGSVNSCQPVQSSVY